MTGEGGEGIGREEKEGRKERGSGEE